MKPRRFTDSKGVEWHVYAVVVAPGAAIMEPALSHQFHRSKTYLAFDSVDERRRLTPFPVGWDEAPVEELERLLAVATKVTWTLGRDR